MAEDQQSSENADKKPEQSSGWWTSRPIQPTNNYGSVTSTKFFDQPPLIFAALMWAFPYSYFYITIFTAMGISLLFKACGGRVSEYLTPGSLLILYFAATLIFFVMLLVKGRWFLNNLFALLIVWLVLILSAGVTQGAVTQAISRAFSAGY